LPGGNGLQFDWSVLANKKWSKPWMLAGGLNAANVEKAVKVTNARQLDLSSSIELSPGVKDPEKIKDFMRALENCNFEKNLDKIS
jgi:phosphoribosylanthranilate isomerase